MLFRQKLIFTTKNITLFFRKEIIITLLVFMSLGSGVIDYTFAFTDIDREKHAWKANHIREVKGLQDTAAVLQFREVEIVPVKYEKPVITQDVSQKTEWGVAKQIDQYTWTMNVQHDGKMASSSEIISALNTYRQVKGKGMLAYDQKLSDYAGARAGFFLSNSGMDSHAGFQDFINNKDGFSALGFNSLGENSSFGYQLEATHLIEWVFAGDAPHDTNQLNPEWSHVGVGVNGQAVDIIFGGRKK